MPTQPNWYDDYPQVSDVQALLLGAGVPQSIIDLQDPQGAIDAAVSLAQYRLGAPLLVSADEVATLRKFDPPSGPILWLGCGLVPDATAQVSVTTRNGVDATPVELVEGQDYFLAPNNASTQHQPYTWIEFRHVQYGLPRSIYVTGVWGYATLLPRVQWSALLAGAVLQLVPTLTSALSVTQAQAGGQIKRKKIGQLEEEYSTTVLATYPKLAIQLPQWQARFDSLLCSLQPSCKLPL